MESKYGHAVNLRQYRNLAGKWQFVPVVRNPNGEPDPRLVLIDGQAVSSKGGTFFLDWRENGKRRSEKAGTTPREALDAWRLKSGARSGEIEPPEKAIVEESAGAKTIDGAIAGYLEEVKALKGDKTYRAYRSALRWCRTHCDRHYISQLARRDVIAVTFTLRNIC